MPRTVDVRCRRWVVRYLLGLVVLPGRKNGARLAALYPPAHRSSVSRFRRQRLPFGRWLEAKAWHVLRQLGWKRGERVYLILDSTYQARRGKKMHNIQKFKVEGVRQYIVGHALVAWILVYRGQRIPLAVEPYRTERWCRRAKVRFRTMPTIAADLLRGLKPPAGFRPIVLFDSGFFGKPVLSALPAGWIYVSVAQRQRVWITKQGVRTSIKDHLAHLVSTPRSFHRTDCLNAVGEKRRYWMRREVGRLLHVGPVTVVFSGRRKQEERWLKPLVTNQVAWSETDVANHYAQRWHIEVWFKEMKQQLGLGHCGARDLTQQRAHLHLCALAYLLAIHMTRSLRAASLGKRLTAAQGEVMQTQWQWLRARAATVRGQRTLKRCLEGLSASN